MTARPARANGAANAKHITVDRKTASEIEDQLGAAPFELGCAIGAFQMLCADDVVPMGVPTGERESREGALTIAIKTLIDGTQRADKARAAFNKIMDSDFKKRKAAEHEASPEADPPPAG